MGIIRQMLNVTGIQQLAPWFNNDLRDDIAVTTADTGYTKIGYLYSGLSTHTLESCMRD